MESRPSGRSSPPTCWKSFRGPPGTLPNGQDEACSAHRLIRSKESFRITDVSEIDGLKLGSGTIFLRNQPAYEQLRVRVGGKAPCGDVFPLGVRTRSETPDVCESSAVNDRGYFPINMHRAGLCRITAELPEARRGEGVTASTTFTVVSQ